MSERKDKNANAQSESKLVKRDPALHANHRNRMREKFLNYGLDVFNEHEILEILLYYALPHKDTNEIAHKLINKAGSFAGVFKLSFDEMKEVSGIKDQAATFLKLIPEIARYYCIKEYELTLSKTMTYEEIATMCINHFIGVTESEQLLVLYFDASMHLLENKTIRGNAYNISACQREIANDCISKGAVNCVIAHNHPTMSLFASSDDLASTKRLRKSLSQLDINLVEHFVVCANSYLGILKSDENVLANFLARDMDPFSD